jgi:hypothetical protein
MAGCRIKNRRGDRKRGRDRRAEREAEEWKKGRKVERSRNVK